MIGFFKRHSISLFVLVLVLAQSGPQIARAVDTVITDNIVFTGPGQNGARDIHTTGNVGGMRFYNSTGLTASPGGAAIQFFGNGHTAFPGQAFIDSGAHNNAALIFRTAGTGGAITERMRIDAGGNVSVTGNLSATGIIAVPRGFQTYTPEASPAIFFVPAGVSKLLVTLWGGGGGGGAAGVTCDGFTFGGAGGGGGGAIQAVFTVSPGDVLTIVVGTGGAADTSGAGTVGGDSTATHGTDLVGAAGGAGGSGTGSPGAGGTTTSTLAGVAVFNGQNGGEGGPGCTPGAGGMSTTEGGAIRPLKTGQGGQGSGPVAGTAGAPGYAMLQW